MYEPQRRFEGYSQKDKIWRGGGTEYIFYWKRAILFLSSSKILTPHPPLRPASLSSPPQHSPGGEGDGGQYFGRREK